MRFSFCLYLFPASRRATGDMGEVGQVLHWQVAGGRARLLLTAQQAVGILQRDSAVQRSVPPQLRFPPSQAGCMRLVLKQVAH